MRIPSMRHASSIFEKLEMDAHDPNYTAKDVDTCTRCIQLLVFFIVAFKESSESANQLHDNLYPECLWTCLLDTDYTIIFMLCKSDCIG